MTICLAVGGGTLLGISGQRLGIPGIVLLLIGGVVLGPEGLGWVRPSTLGHGLETLVAVLVAVILFEGGLTLDLSGYRRAPQVIRRLLSLGPMLTWLGAGLAVHWLYGVSPGFALVAGSLVIVTGPTVVSPLLRRLRVDERLHHILYWEAVLIDAVGVFIAVLCYEWLSSTRELRLAESLARFGMRMLVGFGLGGLGGITMAVVLKRRLIPNSYVNTFVLACALLTFAGSHGLIHESGILSVVVAGLIVAIREPRQLARVQQFKLQLTELAIGTLFILLAAKLELSRFGDPRLLAFLGIIMFVLRPLTVFLSTLGAGFSFREQALLSWIAPRGIVAASMASLLALRLKKAGYEDAPLLETLTYGVIGATVTLQGLSAPLVVGLLRLKQPRRTTWLLAGNPLLCRELTLALLRAGIKAVGLPEHEQGRGNLEVEPAVLADTQGVLCINDQPLANIRLLQQLQPRPDDAHTYRWEPAVQGDSTHTERVGGKTRKVWADLGSPHQVETQLESATHRLDVVEVAEDASADRFGAGLRPLFIVHDGQAELLPQLQYRRPDHNHMVVVLRRSIRGLRDLLADVSIIDQEAPTFEQVLISILERIKLQRSVLDVAAVLESIVNREQSMPTTLGNGVAIPHAYVQGIDQSQCFVAVVRSGLSMPTPDEQPVRLIFLLLSPQNDARAHLRALAMIAELAQESALMKVLAQERTPQRIRRYLMERA